MQAFCHKYRYQKIIVVENCKFHEVLKSKFTLTIVCFIRLLKTILNVLSF